MEVTWRGQKYPVKNDKLEMMLMKVQELEKQIAVDQVLSSKLEKYDKLFALYGDAIPLAEGLVKADTVGPWRI